MFEHSSFAFVEILDQIKSIKFLLPAVVGDLNAV